MKTKSPLFRIDRLLLAALVLLAVPQVQAQTNIWTNPITGTDPGRSNPYTTGDVVASNITVSGIGRGAGVTGNAGANRYTATSWNTVSIDLTAYFTFTLTPTSGFEIDFNSFVYTGQASGSGPTSFAFRSSVDDFAANIGTPNSTGTTISLSGASYQNITSAIEFRLYGWGASAAGGTRSVDQFNFTGLVNSTGGGPTDYFWAGDGLNLGGSGTWNTGNTNWSATNSPILGIAWDSTKKAIFTNPAGTVTVDTVSANAGIQFAADGYTLSGGTLTLGGASAAANTITTDTGVTATINSVLSGSTGMTKAGAGTLVLGGTNNYTGGTLISAGVLQGDTTSLQGTITNSGSIVFNQSTNGAYGSVLSGSGTLIKIGASTLTLSGANAFTGATTISTGALRASNNAALGTVAGGVTVANGAALELLGGITIGAEALNLSGTGISSGGALRNISGNNTYGGTITNTAAARINSDAGTLTLSGAINATNQALTFGGAGDIAVSGAITNSTSTLTKDGAGTLTLSGANTYSGGTLVSGGRLIGTTTSLQGSITNNAAATFDQTTDGTYAGALTGSGSLVKSGAGVVTLSGANSYSGGTLVSAGGLVGTTTSLQGAITNNAAMTFNQNSDGTYNGAMSGTGSLNKTGSGEVTLSGNSTGYSGAITVGNGTLLAASDNAFGTGSVNVTNGSVLANSGRTIANGFTIGAASGSEVYYSQNFNSIGTALPTDWTTRTNASASSLGTSQAFTTTEFTWVDSGGAFKNFASATGLSSGATTAEQNDSADRALGIRPSGSFGDPGASFQYVFTTTGETIDSISFDLMMLDVQGRSTTYTIQYGVGAAPTSFTTLGTWSDPGVWGTTALTFDTGDFGSSLDNQANLVFRVVSLSASAGSGSRDSVAIDNFVINNLGGPTGSGTLGISEVGTATFSGNILNNNEATFTAASGGTATFSGAISGAGTLNKSGTGTVTLSGNNTFTGALNVHDGTLEIASINNNSANGPLGNSTNPVSLGKSGTANVSTLHYTGGTASTTKGFSMASVATAGVINVANSGTTLTVSGQITGSSGSGLTKTGIGRLSLSGSSSYNGATTVSAGDLNLSGGSIASSAVTVASGASLSGYGSVGTIGGAGAINPGNSPGILTTPQVNPSDGTTFNFEMTGTAPTYNNASNSVNDVIRITGLTPFSAPLAAGNGINIYFSGDALFTGSPKTITGGFFTDQSASFASGATYTYYFANASGTNSYNGANYYNKAQYETAVLSSNLMTIIVTTVDQTANFGSGDINGQVMQVQVIPEPSTYALLGLSAAAFGAYRWRRRHRG